MGFFGVKIFFFASLRSRIFFSRHYFFSTINFADRTIFLPKKHSPPPLQVKWMFPYGINETNLGKERAYGITFYALGYFRSREEYLQFLEAQDIANTTFSAARKLSELAFSIYDASLNDNADIFESIRSMR